MIEALATFMFTLVYVNQVDEDTQFFPKKDKHMNFLFTSISFGIFVLIAYPISGGCLNPAIGFSICFVDLFKTGGGEKAALELGVTFLGKIPLEAQVVQDGDSGTPHVIGHPGSPVAKAMKEVTIKILEQTIKKEG
ncbi:MAG: Mrp/NBP35 family ATP-binding protein [Geovibrio sp.]|nr:Mrp/NBP35 family ATP-binding protein [Geovibrio sp.]